MDLSALRQIAPLLCSDRVLVEAPETRAGTVAALLCLLELMPVHLLPVPCDHPQLREAALAMAARDAHVDDGTSEVPAVLCSSVLDDAELAATISQLDATADAYAAVVQTAELFRHSGSAWVRTIAAARPRMLHVRVEEVDDDTLQLVIVDADRFGITHPIIALWSPTPQT